MIINNFSYFTFSIIDKPLIDIEEQIRKIFKSEILEEKYLFGRQNFYVYKFYENSPPKGSTHLKKIAFYNPVILPEKTICFSNMSDAWETLLNVICAATNSHHITFCLSDINFKEAKNSFEYWDNNKSKRIVMAMKEDQKWIFYESGNILPFENQKNYEKRKIIDRINKDIIISYCEKLNLDITNDDFWHPIEKSLILEETMKNRK